MLLHDIQYHMLHGWLRQLPRPSRRRRRRRIGVGIQGGIIVCFNINLIIFHVGGVFIGCAFDIITNT